MNYLSTASISSTQLWPYLIVHKSFYFIGKIAQNMQLIERDSFFYTPPLESRREWDGACWGCWRIKRDEPNLESSELWINYLTGPSKQVFQIKRETFTACKTCTWCSLNEITWKLDKKHYYVYLYGLTSQIVKNALSIAVMVCWFLGTTQQVRQAWKTKRYTTRPLCEVWLHFEFGRLSGIS